MAIIIWRSRRRREVTNTWRHKRGITRHSAPLTAAVIPQTIT
jgi:hypothetical protein